ncbi:MAG: hypothetical protein ACT4N4_05425 [Rhodospirillales bacterium]
MRWKHLFWDRRPSRISLSESVFIRMEISACLAVGHQGRTLAARLAHAGVALVGKFHRHSSIPAPLAGMVTKAGPRYPLGVGSCDSHAISRRANVVKAVPGMEGLVFVVEIYTIDRITRDFKIVRRPLCEAVASFGRRTIPQCHFVAVGGNGRVALWRRSTILHRWRHG